MLQIYRFLTIVFFPLFVVLILFRKIIGKEDSVRFKEKIYPTDYGLHKNSDENLIWFHGASIGEITSVIPIIFGETWSQAAIAGLFSAFFNSSCKVPIFSVIPEHSKEAAHHCNSTPICQKLITIIYNEQKHNKIDIIFLL